MNRPHQRCLQVFAREPRAGQVKTRLIPSIGADAAKKVYCQLLEDTLEQVRLADVDHRELWIDREPESAYIRQLAERYSLQPRVQIEADLGGRMADAFAAGLAHADNVILIGSDCPELSPTYLNDAFGRLETHDVVFGPTVDGGYILVGLKQVDPGLFSAVGWSRPDVLQCHRDYLGRNGKTFSELPIRHDIDTAEDLKHFRQWREAAPDCGNPV